VSHEEDVANESEVSIHETNAARIYRDDDDIGEFFAQFPGSGYQYGITRLEPKSLMVRGKTQQIRGHLETLMQPPTLDQIRDAYGGGQYLIRVSGPKPGAKGIKFITTARVQIAGDPKPIELEATTDGEDRGTSPALVAKVLDATLDEKRRADARFERAIHSAGPDHSLLKTTLDTIERSRTSQVETLQQQIERRDRELAELRQQRSPFEHPEVIKALFTRGNDDGGRIAEAARRELETERERNQRELENERQRNQRELLAERERATRELAAERERATRELASERERRERDQRDFAQERERLERELKAERERQDRDLAQERRERDSVVQSVERTHSSEVENLKMAHAQVLAMKDDHIGRLHDELRVLRETAKPQDTLSDLQRLGQVVNVVKSFGSNAEEAEPKSTFERVMEYAPAVLDQLMRPAQPQPAAPAPAPRPSAPARAAAPAPVRPVWAPSMAPQIDPRRFAPQPVRHVPTRPVQARPIRPPVPSAVPSAPLQAKAAPQTPAAPSAPTTPPLPLGAWQEGLAYLEKALTSHTPPEEVAKTVRSRLGESAAAALASVGPEVLMAQLETTAPNSDLVSPGGNRFLRKVSEALKEMPSAAP
jgi:hypothetical protein